MNIAAVEQATVAAAERGIRVLNAYLFAETERDHVARLLEFIKPPHGAVVLDAGCGVGEVARIASELRPDLTFKLLNISAQQLEACPAGMERIHRSFEDTGLASASVDVVMFNYAICHAEDWLAVLREAHRVLRPGGVLFINDFARRAGDNELMIRLVGAAAFAPAQIADAARRAGFGDLEAYEHEPVSSRLRDVFGDRELYDLAFAGVYPATFRFVRQENPDPVAWAFQRHDRIGFQFSGGRDSTAALYLLRPYWHRMTVYHLDTGDHFPETDAVVRAVARDVPITIVRTDVEQVRREHGLPTDLVPVDNTATGQLVSGQATRLQSRYECCWRALMQPMHQRMVADGITLIVRGQRDDEYAKPPKRSGDIGEGFEVLYPIERWNAAQVTAYLRENALPIAPFYERGVRRAPECMGCTAWWDEGRAAYMRQYHPEAFKAYKKRMQVVRTAIDRQYGMLDD